MVRTVDTAVVVMAVAAFYRIELSVLNISRGIGLEKSLSHRLRRYLVGPHSSPAGTI